jgi:hypothetical protein
MVVLHVSLHKKWPVRFWGIKYQLPAMQKNCHSWILGYVWVHHSLLCYDTCNYFKLNRIYFFITFVQHLHAYIFFKILKTFWSNVKSSALKIKHITLTYQLARKNLHQALPAISYLWSITTVHVCIFSPFKWLHSK